MRLLLVAIQLLACGSAASLPITDVKFCVSTSAKCDCPAGYKQVAKDLNKGSKGKYIYTCTTTETTAGAPWAAMTAISGPKDSKCPDGYTRIEQDLSEDTRVHEAYHSDDGDFIKGGDTDGRVSSGKQLMVQLVAALSIAVWTLTTSYIVFKSVDRKFGLRVDNFVEDGGLDIEISIGGSSVGELKRRQNHLSAS